MAIYEDEDTDEKNIKHVLLKWGTTNDADRKCQEFDEGAPAKRKRRHMFGCLSFVFVLLVLFVFCIPLVPWRAPCRHYQSNNNTETTSSEDSLSLLAMQQ